MLSVITGFLITLIAYLAAKPINKRFPQIPLLVIGMFFVIGILMIVIWSIAAFGVVFKLAFAHRFEVLSLVIYLTMGWLSLIVIYQLAMKLSHGGVILLAAGGIIYTLGVIFYASKRIRFGHAIWHGFVLGGCFCHFLAIYYYVR